MTIKPTDSRFAAKSKEKKKKKERAHVLQLGVPKWKSPLQETGCSRFGGHSKGSCLNPTDMNFDVIQYGHTAIKRFRPGVLKRKRENKRNRTRKTKEDREVFDLFNIYR